MQLIVRLLIHLAALGGAAATGGIAVQTGNADAAVGAGLLAVASVLAILWAGGFLNLRREAEIHSTPGGHH